MADIKRLPLIVKPSNRDETTNRDAKIVNGYIEIVGEGEYEIYKRPGFNTYNTGSGAATGLGMFTWNGDLYAIFGTTLYKNGSSLGTVNGSAIYSFDSCLGGIPSLVMQNGVAAYYYNTTAGLVNIPMTTAVSVIGTTTSGSAKVTNISPNTSALTNGMTVTATGVPSGTTISSVDSATQFTLSANATSTNVQETISFNTTNLTGNTTSGSAIVSNISPNTTGLFVGEAVIGANIPILTTIQSVDSSTQITLNNPATGTATGSSLSFSTAFPSSQVPGVTYLDGYISVMTQKCGIYASEPNQPGAWLSGNYLIASIEPDDGVRLAKQLVYILAFKKYSVEVFYDAGNASGSPYGAVQGGKVSVGCRHANSVAQLEGSIFWVAQSRDGGTSVWAMDNLKAEQISTPAIERLLQQADYTTVYSWTARVSGHKYYGVTIKNSNLTLVYDITARHWYQWTDTNGNYLPYVSTTYTVDNQVIFQHESNGKTYKLELTNYTDDGNIITWDLYTPNFDGGIRQRKYLKSLDVIGDQTNGSLVQVRYSDDDYQTWTNFRNIDMSKKRSYIMDCGTFRRRAYHFRHACNTLFRVQAVELMIDIGTL